jgi:hypothetical protein
VTLALQPDRKVDIKDNQLGIKLIPMISTWDQVDPIFPVRKEKSPFLSSQAAPFFSFAKGIFPLLQRNHAHMTQANAMLKIENRIDNSEIIPELAIL